MTLETRRERTTRLLHSGDLDSETALDELVPLIYEELRLVARRLLAQERPEHTLQTTALVHEAYLKLVDDRGVTERGRSYFFGAAARAMRQVLVDHARRRATRKRGGGRVLERLEDGGIEIDEFAEDLIDLNDALDKLSQRSPRQARVVECRYFGGLTVKETAAALAVSPRTVKSDWAMARAWLYQELSRSESPP